MCKALMKKSQGHATPTPISFSYNSSSGDKSAQCIEDDEVNKEKGNPHATNAVVAINGAKYTEGDKGEKQRAIQQQPDSAKRTERYKLKKTKESSYNTTVMTINGAKYTE